MNGKHYEIFVINIFILDGVKNLLQREIPTGDSLNVPVSLSRSCSLIYHPMILTVCIAILLFVLGKLICNLSTYCRKWFTQVIGINQVLESGYHLLSIEET